MRPTLHPACAAFPPLLDADMKDLADDIRERGLQEDITIFDGQLLDGKCRWDACEAVGVEPRTIEFGGNNPIAFVLSKNMRRRQLTISQKTMVIAALDKLQHGSNQHAIKPLIVNGKEDGLKKSILSTKQLSKETGVNQTYIKYGRTVNDFGAPHIAELVKAGEVNVRYAAEAVRTTPRVEQATWTAADVHRIGKAVVDAYPSNCGNPKPGKPKKSKKSKTKKGASSPERREYGFHQFPTKEEIDGPPDDAPYEEHAAFTRKYGKVMLHPRVVKDLMDCHNLTEGFAVAVMAAANPTHPEAGMFFEALDQMLAYVPDRTKRNGMERDFAKFARTALGLLETKLPVLLAKLVAYQAALEARRSATESQTALAGALETTSTAAA